ncbi:hypothetical protein LX16_2994 [Stackebrandtia albiflava]|uniref:Uncharacterized protein n=1 Tax=Stackebrandtia albiflava TaxID=406432 RepID=A0A562V2W5_9ACTN|nr:hypothetical protein [Stackebrandtia albiflava]TWJ12239.1 hypothetical protein LX16_2994 [Stackebrandtia albiflava]
MADSTGYGHLTLDDIARLTAADAADSGELHAQARAIRAVAARVDAAVTAVRAARTALTERTDPEGRRQIERLFAGLSAAATVDRLDELSRRGGTGHHQVVPQPEVLTELAGRADVVNAEIQRLVTERDETRLALSTNPSDPELVSRFGSGAGTADAVDLHYDRLARERFSGAATDYRATVDTLPPVEPAGSDGAARHRWKPDSDKRLLQERTWRSSKSVDIGPTLQGGTWTSDVVIVDNATGSGPKSEPGGNTVVDDGRPGNTGPADATRTVRLTPRVTPRPPVTPSMTTFVPDRSVTSPVIGARGTGQAPVIAPRPGFAASGVLPPTIGNRAIPPGFASVPSSTGTPPASPRGSGLRYRIRPTVVASGRVITARPPSAAPAPPPAPRFDRAPRIRHGGDDRPNRAVIGNGRLPRRPVPPATVRCDDPVEATDPGREWLPDIVTTPTVIRGRNSERPEPPIPYHGDDTGPVITAYSLGDESRRLR